MAPEIAAAKELATLISRLQSERTEHLEAIAQIDATFERFGITVAPPAKRRGRPRKTTGIAVPAKAATKAKVAKQGKPRKRRTFPVTGLDSILAFVKAAGRKGATTSEIVKHWKAEGRSGDGYTALSLLAKDKKLKKAKLKDGKGSMYTVA